VLSQPFKGGGEGKRRERRGREKIEKGSRFPRGGAEACGEEIGEKKPSKPINQTGKELGSSIVRCWMVIEKEGNSIQRAG